MTCKKCGGKQIKRGQQKNRQRYFCTSCHTWSSEALGSRVLVVPDLHTPFMKQGTVDFLEALYDKYDCNQVVFIGDIMDNHYSSFHDTDPDGFGGREELQRAISQIGELIAAFPSAKVVIGNHDAIPQRRVFNSGLSSSWVRTIDEVLTSHGLDVSGWEFADKFVIDGIKYTHGTGRKAKQRMIQDGMSVVQGHYHSESYILYHSNDERTNFAMQIGALIDDEAYAFAYNKHFATSHQCAGVVLDGVPIIEFFK